MIGTTIAHYRVEEKLGEGGMGEVYLADDTSLQRKVALKVLPEFLQKDEAARKRFLREARSAAAINHPYICNIHEVIQSDEGQSLVVMEYVEGQTFKEKLEAGPLSVQEAVRIALEMGEALQLAHHRGIIHRDLKPSNIMLTSPEQHVKLMDFGLAKRIGTADGGEQEITTTLTREGSTLGTLAYMSPEQLKGAPVDSRSDIFSFGIVLYEMLTGKHPFRRGQSVETVSAILMMDPAPLRQLNEKIPESLEETVLKMVARNREERYQSIQEVVAQLKASGSQEKETEPVGKLWGLFSSLFGRRRIRESSDGLRPRVSSLAVLPLTNLSGDAAQEYFADGMTEALITDLAKIGALKVISRSSTMSYKGTRKPLARIARELKVEAVVEGSVLREGDRVGITAQLIEAATGQSLWADRYEKNLTSILSLQSEVAQAIAREIQVTLTPGEQALLARTREVNPEAYEAYLKGLSHFYKLIPPELEKAKQYFEEALEKDPEFALAHVGIALVWIGFRQMGAVPPSEAGPKVKAALDRAFDLDDSVPEAYFALAGDKTWGEWDWEAGEAAFLRAIELKPNYPDAIVYYSNLLCYLGRVDEAVELAERATQLDPFNPLFQSICACTLAFSKRFEEAITRCRNALKASPEDPVALSSLWEIHHHLGNYEEAGKFAKAALVTFGSTQVVDAYDQGYAEGGYKGAMKRVADLMAEFSRETFVLPFWIAETYLFAGDKERALEWFEKGYEIQSPMMPYIIWPVYESLLRDESRYQDILRKMDFPDRVITTLIGNLEN